MASALARRYATATFEVAQEHDMVDRVGGDLTRAALLISSPEVEAVLSNPRVAVPDRTGLVLGIAEEATQPVRNLLRLLVERGRTRLLADIAGEYRAMAEAAGGVLRAVVSSARPLDAAAQQRIERALTARFGRPVSVDAEPDPNLIGGLVIRVGDQVIDDSLRTHLQQLQAAIA
jgi:F-type H+-transporting ATPase subunit delta